MSRSIDTGRVAFVGGRGLFQPAHVLFPDALFVAVRRAVPKRHLEKMPCKVEPLSAVEQVPAMERVPVLDCPFATARQLLSPTTRPSELLGRTTEEGAVREFVLQHVAVGKAGSLYISGQPGTGKTATVSMVQRKLASSHPDLRFALVNCMARDPKRIFESIAAALGLPAKRGSDTRTMLDSKVGFQLPALLRLCVCGCCV